MFWVQFSLKSFSKTEKFYRVAELSKINQIVSLATTIM